MSTFLDDATKTALGWAEVWSLFQPLSKAGLRYKRDVRPFGIADRQKWLEAMVDLKMVKRALSDEAWKQKMCDLLREMPDVLSLLGLIEQGASVRQVDFFELKTFLWKAWQLEELLQAKGLALTWWRLLDWPELVGILNGPGVLVPEFGLAELGDEGFAALRGELARLDGALYAGKKEQADRLRARYGRAPSRDGQYVWEKTDAAAVARAEQDEELRLLAMNMFEAVFEVVEPAESIAWRAQQEQVLLAIEDREADVLRELVQQFRPHVDAVQAALHAVARLDWTLAKAQVALRWQAGEALWLDEAAEPWQVVGGWHPAAREAVQKRGGAYTFLDMELACGVGLITGPNMGGKTVVLKTFGLLQALAQYGMPVPAARFAFHPVERIGLSGGDEQSMDSGLSSFGAEVQRLAELLQGGARALLLLDEVARTTNPEEGEVLAIGLAGYLLQSGHAALMASHFPGVTGVPGIQGFRVAGLKRDVLDELERQGRVDMVRDLQQAMDYRLIPCAGQEVPRDAVRLARCFGLPEGVLQKAQEVLDRKEGETKR